MNQQKKTVISTIPPFLRWALFIPGAITAYILTNWLNSVGYARAVDPEIVHLIAENGGLGGKYIKGAFFLLQIEFTSTTAALLTALYIAPKNRKRILHAYAILLVILFGLVCFNSITYQFDTEIIIATIISMSAKLIAFSSIYIYREELIEQINKLQENNQNNANKRI